MQLRVLRENGRTGTVQVGLTELRFDETGPQGSIAEFSGSSTRCEQLRRDIAARRGYSIIEDEAPAAIKGKPTVEADPAIEADKAPPSADPDWLIAGRNGWTRDDLTGNLAFWVGNMPSTVTGLSIADMAATPPPEDWGERRGQWWAWECDTFRAPNADWKRDPGLASRRGGAPAPAIADATAGDADDASATPGAGSAPYAGDLGILAEVKAEMLAKGTPSLNKFNAMLRRRGQPALTDEQYASSMTE